MTLTCQKFASSKMENPRTSVPSDLLMEELKEKLRISEEGRKSLQQKFDVMMQSYRIKEEARYKALKRRYGAFLEEDQRRQQRNESLLQTLERVDIRTANLAARTQRLALLRKHYEQYLGRIYPTWRPASHRRIATPAPSLKLPDDRDQDVSGYGSHTGSSMLYFRENKHYAEQPRMAPMSTPKQNVPSFKADSILPDKYKLSRVDFDMPSISVIRAAEDDRSLDQYSTQRSKAREASPPRSRQQLSPRAAGRIAPDLSPRASRNDEDVSPRGARRSPEVWRSERLSPPRHHPEFEVDQNTSGDLLNMSLSEDGVSSLSRSDVDASPSRRHHWETLKQGYLNRSQRVSGARDAQRSSALDQDSGTTDWSHQQAKSQDVYDVRPNRNQEQISEESTSEQDSPGRESFRDKIRRLKIMVQENKQLESLADANEPRETTWKQTNADKTDQLDHGERRKRSVYDPQSSVEPQGNENALSRQDQRARADVQTNRWNQETPKEEKPTAEHIQTRRMSVSQPDRFLQEHSSLEETSSDYQRRKSQQWTNEESLVLPDGRRENRNEKPLSDATTQPNNVQSERRSSELENKNRNELHQRQSVYQEETADLVRRNEEREYYQHPPEDISTKRDSFASNKEQQHANPTTYTNLEPVYTDGQYPNEQAESRYVEERQRALAPNEQLQHSDNRRRDSMKQNESSHVVSNPGPDTYDYGEREYAATDAPQISNNNDGERQYYEDNSGYTEIREQQQDPASYNEAPQSYDYNYNQDNNAQYGYGQEYTNNQADNRYPQQQQREEDYNQVGNTHPQQQHTQEDYNKVDTKYPQQPQRQEDYNQVDNTYPQQQQRQEDYNQADNTYPQHQQRQEDYNQANEQGYYQDNAYYAQQGSNNTEYNQQYSEQEGYANQYNQDTQQQQQYSEQKGYAQQYNQDTEQQQQYSEQEGYAQQHNQDTQQQQQYSEQEGYAQQYNQDTQQQQQYSEQEEYAQQHNQDTQQQYNGDSKGWAQDPNQQQTSLQDQRPQSEQYGYYDQENQEEYKQNPQSQHGNEFNYQQQDPNPNFGSTDAERRPDSAMRDDEQGKYVGGYYHDISDDSTQQSDISHDRMMEQSQQSPSQGSVERYRTMLGVEPNSEPSFSEVDEIEAEMAAVVAGGTKDAKPQAATSPKAAPTPAEPPGATSQSDPKPRPTDAKQPQLHTDSSDFDY